MSKQLLEKAQTTMELEETKKYLEDTYEIRDINTLNFIIEYIKTRDPVKSYRSVYGQHISTNVAFASASRKLRHVKFSIRDILNLQGHDYASIAEALTQLKKQSPDKYLTHLEKLHQLDIQQHNHTGSITIKFEKDLDEES